MILEGENIMKKSCVILLFSCFIVMSERHSGVVRVNGYLSLCDRLVPRFSPDESRDRSVGLCLYSN